MTREEAIRILDPETTGEALAEIEYYGGFRGRTKAAQALYDACVLAVAALREQENRRWVPVTERLPEVVLTHRRRRSIIKKSVRVLCVCVQNSGKSMVKEGYCEWYNDYPEPR